MSEQLELPLWETLRSAQVMPDQLNLGQVLGLLEGAIAQRSEREQLQLAGEALLQVAELCALRADLLLSQWEEADRDPVVEAGFFADVVRQTMAVDLSELMEPAPPRKPRTRKGKPAEPGAGSVVAEVDKMAVLALVEQWEREAEGQKQQVLAIAHPENVSGWIEAIAQGLQAAGGDRVSFAQLCQSLSMLPVEVWLGLLLGGFEIQQVGEFYSNAVWVKGPPI